MIVEVLLLILSLLLYFGFYKPPQSFQQRGIKCARGVLPLIGNCKSVIFKQKHLSELVKDLYNEYPNERYNGIFRFNLPELMIRDIELIKKIGIKDFNNFIDHIKIVEEDNNELIGRSLIALTGEKWRDMRVALSPVFTSGKMKIMFELINKCAANVSNYLLKNNDGLLEIEFEDIITKFSNDVIASTAFGLNVDSLKYPENEFYQNGLEASNITGLRTLVIFVPSLAKILGIKFIPDSVEKFFKNVIVSNIEQRKSQGITRPDLIHLLLEASKGRAGQEIDQNEKDPSHIAVEHSEVGKDYKNQMKEWDDDDITAQALIFFFAGFSSVSLTSCFMAQELAMNSDIQEKLRKEIDETHHKYNGVVTYDALMNNMKYLDQVVSETLRKWPTAFMTDRVCAKDYVIPPVLPTEQQITIKKGEAVMFPIYGIHRDPKYFPEPEKFDPDRFSVENKHKIISGTYFPFGIGPRNCIGSRFALLEIKIFFYHLLSKFELVVIDKTEVSFKLNPSAAFPSVDKGFWLGVKKR